MAKTKTADTEEVIVEDVEEVIPVETPEEKPAEVAEVITEEDKKFEKRFNQFKGETPEEYIKNLEDAYANSTTEAQTLKKRADEAVSIIANNPEVADRAEAPSSESTTDLWAKTKMAKEQETEFNEFVAAHPEVSTDPTLSAKLLQELEIFSAAVFTKERRLIGMKEGLEKAWISLGLNDNKETTLLAAKDNAAQSRTTANAPQVAQSDLTENQIAVGAKLFPNLSRAELVKKLSQYKK